MRASGKLKKKILSTIRRKPGKDSYYIGAQVTIPRREYRKRDGTIGEIGCGHIGHIIWMSDDGQTIGAKCMKAYGHRELKQGVLRWVRPVFLIDISDVVNRR